MLRGRTLFIINRKQKIKIKKSQGKYNLSIKVKVSNDYIVNVSQYERITDEYDHYFLKCVEYRKNSLYFQALKLGTLSQRFKTPISKYDFFFIIEQLSDLYSHLEQSGLSADNLILDIDNIFINLYTKKIMVIYLPIENGVKKVNSFLKFIKSIFYYARPENSAQSYFDDFGDFIRKMQTFNSKEIDDYIYKKIDSSIVNTIKNINKNEGKYNNIEERYKSRKETIDDDKTEMSSAYFNRNSSIKNGISGFNLNERLWSENIGDEETVYCDVRLENKTKSRNENNNIRAILIRKSTHEVIRIDKDSFRIGKEENCVDYVVIGNYAVSRNHLDIITRNGKYYVFDLHSKNKTYINGRIVPPEYEVEIFDGDILKIANEEFKFQL